MVGDVVGALAGSAFDHPTVSFLLATNAATAVALRIARRDRETERRAARDWEQIASTRSGYRLTRSVTTIETIEGEWYGSAPPPDNMPAIPNRRVSLGGQPW